MDNDTEQVQRGNEVQLLCMFDLERHHRRNEKIYRNPHAWE